MGGDTAAFHPFVDDFIIIALVEAEVQRPEAWAWDILGGGVQRGQRNPHVGHVGPADGDAERYTALIRQHMPLRARLGPVGRVGPGVLAALRAIGR